MSPKTSPKDDPRDGITSSESISYRKTFANHPYELPSLCPSVDQGFHSIADPNTFEREHYSAHYINPLYDNASDHIYTRKNNALIYWLITIHTIVNDIITLNIDNTPSNHGERNLVNTIKTLDTQLDQLSVITHDVITPCLTFHPERVNNQDKLIMTDHLAAHFGVPMQEMHHLKRQLKTPQNLLFPSPNQAHLGLLLSANAKRSPPN